MGWVCSQNGYYLQRTVCLHRSPGIVGTEKWRKLLWAGYVARIDITYLLSFQNQVSYLRINLFSTVIRLLARRPTSRASVPRRSKVGYISFSPHSRPVLGPSNHSTVASFLVLKRLAFQVPNSPPSTVQVDKEWSCKYFILHRVLVVYIEASEFYLV